jgi:ferredoxin/flavodoxin---NADP+ reductase
MRTHRVLEVRTLSAGAFVVRFTRDGLEFQAGQWVNIGLPRHLDQREYTIYSSPNDEHLEVLVREVPQGAVSPALRRLSPGDPLEVEGPHGGFTLVEGTRMAPRFLFLATGTGVSPFHCFVKTRPDIDYRLVHGVRSEVELYDRALFAPGRYAPCISKEPETRFFRGRLTAYLLAHPAEPALYCYLCGNSDMIYEAYAILSRQGVPRGHIFAETYF